MCHRSGAFTLNVRRSTCDATPGFSAVLVGVATAAAAFRTVAAAQPTFESSRRTGETRSPCRYDEGSLWYSLDRDGKPTPPPVTTRFRVPRRAALGRQLAPRRLGADDVWTRHGRSRGVRWPACATSITSLRVTAEETTSLRRRFVVVFRAFDDGVASATSSRSSPGSATSRSWTSGRSSRSPTTRGRGGSRRTSRDSIAPSSCTPSSPLSMIDSIQTPVTLELARRPHGDGDPRSEPRGLSANVHRRARDGEQHAARGAGAHGRWREGPGAHAVLRRRGERSRSRIA